MEKAFTLLEPGPVTMVTTALRGKANVMTITWHSVLDFTPRFALVTGPWNYSYGALKKTGECVIAIPTVELMKKVIGVGTTTGADTDKLDRFKLTAASASRVQAPLITDCYANIECRVTDHIAAHGYFRTARSPCVYRNRTGGKTYIPLPRRRDFRGGRRRIPLPGPYEVQTGARCLNI